MTPCRCSWAGDDPMYVAYHDIEWGVPVHDDRTHFEFLVLEGAQAGLSWLTVLRRREGYRRVFRNFDPGVVASFGEEHVAAALEDPGIIRNRAKVRSAVANARAFLALRQEFGSFDRFIWQFVGGRPRVNGWTDVGQIPATSPESEALSRELKRRGFSFVGPTVMYAHMQACGLVNDHTVDCFRHRELAALAGISPHSAR